MDSDTYGGKNYPIHNRLQPERCEVHNPLGSEPPDPERGLMGFGCTNMGISSGCSDEYEAALDCQWIDITDTPDGNYWLTVATNWDEAGREETSPENDYTNNEVLPSCHLLATYTRITTISPSRCAYSRHSPGAHGPPSTFHFLYLPPSTPGQRCDPDPREQCDRPLHRPSRPAVP